MSEESYHHGALRQALVAAAQAMLEEGEALSMRAVARRAGVSHAAPYHHFADRRSLLAAVAREGLLSLMRAVDEVGRREGTGGGRRLVELGVTYVRFALEHPALFRLMFGTELSDRSGLPELQAAFAEARQRLFGLAGGYLGPDVDPEELRLWALRGWSTVHGLAGLILDDQVVGVRSIEEAEGLARKVLKVGVAPGVVGS